MSGHSKWSTIKRSKGIEDAKRGLTFTKLANAITIAAKLGNSGNPDDNPRLRMAIDEAKSVNVPKENIQRAIDRGLGKLPGQVLEEVIYEGFGPEKTAFIVEGVTDNKMRTLQMVKNLFERSGGALAQVGAVSYMFDHVGEIKLKSKNADLKDKDNEILELIDLGAEDVEEFVDEGEQKYLVYTQGVKVAEVSIKITQAGYTVESSNLIYKPNITIEISDSEKAQKVLDFAEKMEELEDVQKVYANFDISDEILNAKP